jgi:outer membrane protein assembly factor BamB
MENAMHVRWIAALIVAAPLALAQTADAQKNWASWRGPLGTGAAPLADPPTEWAESKNIRWKVAIPGRGHAAPIVWNDRVYVLTAVPTASEKPPEEAGGGRRRPQKPTAPIKYTVLALDRKTGATVWEKVVKEETPHEGTHPDSTYASASPLTDGERLYAFFGSAGLYALDLDGKVLWEKDLGDLRITNSFGEGASPALSGDTIFVPWDHEGDDFLVALNKKTGDQIWKVERQESTAWATPLVVDVGGKPQVIVNAAQKCCGYDAKTGELVWETGGMTKNVVPSPVEANGIAILMSGFRGAACKAIKLAGAKGDLTDAAIVWTYDKDTPYVPSPLLYRDCLYFLENNKAVLTCLDAKTGQKHYGPQRIEGVQGVYASIVGAADRVYIAGRDGKVVVLKVGPTFEILATNTLEEGFDSSPALVGDTIFLRGREHLYCIGK